MREFLKISVLSLFAALISSVAYAEKEMSVDIVIVGAGAGGTAAMTAALDAGAKIVVLEKMPNIGGTANFAEGIFGFETSLQEEKEFKETRQKGFQFIMDYSHWRANALLVKKIVDYSADTVDWIQTKGVKFQEVGTMVPGGNRTWHVFEGLSKNMIKILHERAKNVYNFEAMLETPGKQLIMKDGKVVGIWAEDIDGEKIKINAGAVIIATGGFANDKEMLAKYTRYPDIIPVGNIGKTGDGIKMAWEAGAAAEGLEVMESYRPAIPGEGVRSSLQALARQPYLWVNANGIRFTNEENMFLWPYAGNAVERQPGGIMYSIFDESIKEYTKIKGIDSGVGKLIPIKTKLTDIDKELERGIKEGKVIKGKNIGELAKKLGVNEGILTKTFNDYNEMATKGFDTFFYKDNKFVRPIVNGPFYAVRLYPSILGTLGGVRINEKIEAVDKNDIPIPGLYVTGNDAGGMYGDSYDLVIGGGTLGFAINSGRLAVENALLYMNFKK